MPGDALPEGGDHVRNDEKPPVARRDLDEVADQAADAGAIENGW